ncbi:MAG: hypothetical protein RL420_1648 [Pseudomonadota bacterium]
MKNHLNQLSRAWALGLTLCLAGVSIAQTTPFPSKTIKIVVPNAAGGAADITARTVAQKLSESLGQSVVTENKPSAGGIVAGEQVARAEPDGHTLLLISSGTAVSASLFKTLPFDTVKDFIPVSKLATFDLVIAVAEGGRFKTFAELMAYAKANPGKLNIGTPQIGTTQNLSAEYFLSASGLQAPSANRAVQWHAARHHCIARRQPRRDGRNLGSSNATNQIQCGTTTRLVGRQTHRQLARCAHRARVWWQSG